MDINLVIQMKRISAYSLKITNKPIKSLAQLGNREEVTHLSFSKN